MKLSQVQRDALVWYSLPRGFRDYEGRKRGIGAPKHTTIEALIRRGLLERVPHPDAHGYTLVQLTDAGRAGAR